MEEGAVDRRALAEDGSWMGGGGHLGHKISALSGHLAHQISVRGKSRRGK